MNTTAYAHQFSAKIAAQEHTERVRLELIRAGITRHGLSKSEARYLPHIIGAKEHIGGVVYGLASVGSVMLVATNERMIYLDRKPLFDILDDIRYEVVSGLRVSKGPFTTVTLHTRIHDFTLKYVNPACARIFEQYVAERCLESPSPFRPLPDEPIRYY